VNSPSEQRTNRGNVSTARCNHARPRCHGAVQESFQPDGPDKVGCCCSKVFRTLAGGSSMAHNAAHYRARLVEEPTSIIPMGKPATRRRAIQPWPSEHRINTTKPSAPRPVLEVLSPCVLVILVLIFRIIIAVKGHTGEERKDGANRPKGSSQKNENTDAARRVGTHGRTRFTRPQVQIPCESVLMEAAHEKRPCVRGVRVIPKTEIICEFGRLCLRAVEHK